MSYFVDQDEILFRKTLKFSFVFYVVIGVGVALVHLRTPKQPDIKNLSNRVAKLILDAPQVTPPPKVVIPPPKIVAPPPVKAMLKPRPKKPVVAAPPKPAKTVKKKPEKPKVPPRPSAEQNREIARKTGLLASLITEEEDGALGQIMEDAQLNEALSSVNVISSPPTKKKNRSRLRTVRRPGKSTQVDSRIAGLGAGKKGRGIQLAKREVVTVTQISAQHGGADGQGHGLGQGIGLQLQGTGSGNTAIDYDAIARVVDKYKGGLVYLYNKALRTNPTLKGTVTVEFSIDENGKVVEAHITTSTMDHADLEKMLARRIKRWKFPKLYHGIIVVTYPFVFFPV